MTSIAAYLAGLAGGAPTEGQNAAQGGATGVLGQFAAILGSSSGETTGSGAPSNTGLFGILNSETAADPAVLAQLAQLAQNDPEIAKLLSEGLAVAPGDIEAAIEQGDVEGAILPAGSATSDAAPDDVDALIATTTPSDEGEAPANPVAAPLVTPNQVAPNAASSQSNQNRGLENALKRSSARGQETGLQNALRQAPQAGASQPQNPANAQGQADADGSGPRFEVSTQSENEILPSNTARDGRPAMEHAVPKTVQRILDAGNGKSIIQIHERIGGEPVGTASPPALTVNMAASVASPGPASPNTPQVPVSALAVHIAQAHKNGAKRFDIRLDPPELGRIEVRIDVNRDGQVSTHLVVERSETLDLLQRDARQLERALQNAGLSTSEDGMKFSLKDQGLAHGQADQNDNADGKDVGDDANGEPSEADLAEAMPPPKEYLASTGIDIRI